MKRRALFLIAVFALVCMLTIFVGAEENANTYYLVQSMDSEAAAALQLEGKSNIVTIAELTSNSSTEPGEFFNNLSDGASVEFVLAENIVTNGTEYKCILINKAISVTMRYNGFIHAVINGSRYNGIVLNNSGASLKLIGSMATDENGVISQEFIKPTIKDGVVTERGNLDVYHSGKVYVWFMFGEIYAENLRSFTHEEVVFGGDNSAKGTHEFNSCACDSNRGAPISIGGQSGKTVNVNKGYYSGISAVSVVNGSLVKDAIIGKFGVLIDSWHGSPQTWTFENCTIAKVSSSTGRTHYVFKDCDLSETTWSLGGDGWGDQFVRIYTSPTCTEDGTLTVKRSTNKGYPASYYDDEVANFSSPKLGHSADLTKIVGVTYESYLLNGTYIASCERCNVNAKADQSTALPLFVFLGYSTPEDGSYGIVASYTLNLKAILEYETLTGTTLNYGIVAAAKQNLGENNPLDINGNVVTLEKGNVVKSEISKDYAAYDFILKGMKDNQLDTELVIATYVEVVTENNEKSVVYLQSQQKTNALSVISYNTIPNK